MNFIALEERCIAVKTIVRDAIAIQPKAAVSVTWKMFGPLRGT